MVGAESVRGRRVRRVRVVICIFSRAPDGGWWVYLDLNRVSISVLMGSEAVCGRDE